MKLLKKQYADNIFEARGEDPLERLLLLLDKNKIGILVEDPSVFEYTANLKDYSKERFKLAGLLGDPVKLYIAFHDEEHAKIFDEGYELLVKSGKIDEILKKYSLRHWQEF